MNVFRHIAILLGILSVLVLAPQPAEAGKAPRWMQKIATPSAEREQAPFSLDQAVAKVRRETGGKVIRAETRWRDGRPVHHIKVLSDQGRVRNLRVDGRSGRIQ